MVVAVVTKVFGKNYHTVWWFLQINLVKCTKLFGYIK